MWREVVRVFALCFVNFMVLRAACNQGVITSGKVLKESVFKYKFQPDVYSCAASCQMHALCKSFNFYIKDKLCFLNYNSSEDINNFEDDADFIQSDIGGWPHGNAGPCQNKPCSKYEECTVDRLGRSSCKLLKVMHVEYDKGTEYTLMKERLNWTQAKLSCEERDGHMAIVEDERENQFIITMLIEFGTPLALVWFGATDEVVEDSWFWVNGEPIVFTGWMTGQPNNPGNQDCAGIIASSGWKSNPCSFDYRFLCEMKL